MSAKAHVYARSDDTKSMSFHPFGVIVFRKFKLDVNDVQKFEWP